MMWVGFGFGIGGEGVEGAGRVGIWAMGMGG